MFSTKLPESLEKKRKTIARMHNRMVLLITPVFSGGLFGVLHFLRTVHEWGKTHPLTITTFSVFLILAGILFLAWFLWFVKWYDNRLCRELDFMCPYCKKPLYVILTRETGSDRLFAGRCPKCDKDLNAKLPETDS